MNENSITDVIINKCIKIHKIMDPGLLESVYQELLFYELNKDGIRCKKQVEVPVKYENIKLNIGFRADLIVEECIIVDLKAIENILPVHKKQLLTYLKMTGLKVGLLINFNEVLIKNGITRIVNDF